MTLLTRLFLLLLTLAIFDFALGYFFIPKRVKEVAHIKNLHPYYNHGFNPLKDGFCTHGSLRYPVSINSLGMTDAYKRIVKNDAKKKRVLFIGDSFVEGVGLPFSKTFCGFLKSMVDTNKVDILNAGVASFSPKLYFYRLKYLIEYQKCTPNEVFCFIDYSDYGDELIYEDFSPKLPNSSDQLLNFLRANSISYNFYHWVMQYFFLKKMGASFNDDVSFLYWVKTNNSFLNRYTDFLTVRQYWLFPKHRKSKTFTKAVALVEANMDSINSLCIKYNIALKFVMYPRMIYKSYPDSIGSYPESLVYNYCRERKIESISLFKIPEFENSKDTSEMSKYFIPRDSHWNENGHYLVAKELIKHLI